MQSIFNGAKIYTMNSKEPSAEALLVNDGVITIATGNAEAQSLKGNDFQEFSIEGKVMLPTFFLMIKNLYGTLKQEFENEKLQNELVKPQKIAKIREKDIEKQFLKFQDKILGDGVMTLIDNCIDESGLDFYKHLSENQLLKIDIIGIVEYQKNRHIMEENCKTYRKYVNRFRLSGYSVFLDGNFEKGKAYKSERIMFRQKRFGYCNYNDEHLEYIFKSILDEKKQLFANGNLAVDQFIRCFGAVTTKNQYDDLFRPTLCISGRLSKRQLLEIKNLNVALVFDTYLIEELSRRQLRSYDLAKSDFLPLGLAKSVGLKFLVYNSKSYSFSKLMERAVSMLSNRRLSCDENKLRAIQMFTIDSAEQFFDENIKGSLESGKQADFVVASRNLAEGGGEGKFDLQVYHLGNLVKTK